MRHALLIAATAIMMTSCDSPLEPEPAPEPPSKPAEPPSNPAEPPSKPAPAKQADAKHEPTKADSAVLAFAKQTRDGVCACKDDDCGQALLDAAGKKMPALLEKATPDERAQIGTLRDEAFRCMDALVDAAPEVKAALAAMQSFVSAVCECKTQDCAKSVLDANAETLAGHQGMSDAAAGEMLIARGKAMKCLETIGYVGSTVAGLAAKADAIADKVCACKDATCRERTTYELGRLFADALTPDDMAIVREATGRVSKCAAAAG